MKTMSEIRKVDDGYGKSYQVHRVPVDHPLRAEIDALWSQVAAARGWKVGNWVGQVGGDYLYEGDGRILGWSIEEVMESLRSETSSLDGE